MVYIDSLNEIALWFDGKSNWWIGKFSNIDEGRLSFGWMYSPDFLRCPNEIELWQESIGGGNWVSSTDINIICDGMFNLFK